MWEASWWPKRFMEKRMAIDNLFARVLNLWTKVISSLGGQEGRGSVKFSTGQII